MAEKETKIVDVFVADLFRPHKRKTRYIVLPKFEVDVQIELTAKGLSTAPSSQLKRFENAALDRLNAMADVVVKAAQDKDKEIQKILNKPGGLNQKIAEAEAVQADFNKLIDRTVGSVKRTVVKQAVDQRINEENRRKQHLFEAKVIVGAKAVKSTLKIGTAATRAATSGGIDMAALYTIVSEARALWKLVENWCRSEEKLREALVKALEEYISHSEKAVESTANEFSVKKASDLKASDLNKSLRTLSERATADASKKGKKLDPVATFKKMKNFVENKYKDRFGKCNKARLDYLNYTTKCMKKVDKVSGKADTLKKALLRANDVETAKKLAPKVKEMKEKVEEMATFLEGREKFLDKIDSDLSATGANIDLPTIRDKIKKLNLTTIATQASNVGNVVYATYNLGKQIKDAAT